MRVLLVFAGAGLLLMSLGACGGRAAPVVAAPHAEPWTAWCTSTSNVPTPAGPGFTPPFVGKEFRELSLELRPPWCLRQSSLVGPALDDRRPGLEIVSNGETEVLLLTSQATPSNELLLPPEHVVDSLEIQVEPGETIQAGFGGSWSCSKGRLEPRNPDLVAMLPAVPESPAPFCLDGSRPYSKRKEDRRSERHPRQSWWVNRETWRFEPIDPAAVVCVRLVDEVHCPEAPIRLPSG